MPIHLHANAGDYAEVCLLPGDPLRAKYISERYFENAVQVNEFRGLLGYTGEFDGKRVSVQGTGMGCPTAAIVMEELAQLGVTRFMRVGTCGSLQGDLHPGELVIPLSAAAADGTSRHYVGDEPHCPTASWTLVHAAVHQAKELDQPVRVGPIVTSDTFYDPDTDRHSRWSDRGLLAVEMEAAVIFTIAALRKAQAGAILTVSDYAVRGAAMARISDEDLQVAVDRMTQLALSTVVEDH